MVLDSDSPAPAAQQPPQSGRKGSKKVRTGCITCKIRKVKCDEAKPFCMRCTKTGRRCDGYLDAKAMAQRRRRPAMPATSRPGEQQAALPVFHSWTSSSDERRAFHFFQHITAPCLSGDLDGAFWRVLVLQVCQTEPAVRHAVLAVSSLHESMVANQGAPKAEDRNSFALYQYNRAIACLLDQMRTVDARPLVPLMTCVLFVCIELMQSKDRESLLHLEQGRQILNQLGRRGIARTPETNLIKQHLVPMYTRLSLTTLMFGGEPVEMPAPLKILTEIPFVFETIDQVRYALYDFMDECLRFSKKTRVAKLSTVPAEKMREFERQQDYLLRKLARFNVAFSMYRSSLPLDSPPDSVALLQVHALTTFIWVSTALSQHETVFDDYVETFSAIIPLATEFINSLNARPPSGVTDARRFGTVFTFEMSIIAPLYFVAAKCRHPVIRRAALELLRRNPARRENLWRAGFMAVIAERTMRLEEKHLRPESRPHSRQPSPPELSGLFPDPATMAQQDPWGPGVADSSFTAFGNVVAPRVTVNGSGSQPFHGFDASQQPLPVTSSCSSTTSPAADAGSLAADLGRSSMTVDPVVFFDPADTSTAASFSVATSISSLDDFTRPTTSTSYLGVPSSTAAEAVDHWSGASTPRPPPGIALKPPTPLGIRSPSPPFDVPERFGVHESILGPTDNNNLNPARSGGGGGEGTSWVMLFRKLGGLEGEWDVLTEYVAVS
ncbi:hypothetical protein VTJ49DRAFT_1376 [Mycothermus thermophilus]|uniref:Zn(2)-C6 fungal-type domain-containing protein n=1 Tax=Humicola insolens TaxID=85995 RepID=A0ABR3VPW3_HUMIN